MTKSDVICPYCEQDRVWRVALTPSATDQYPHAFCYECDTFWEYVTDAKMANKFYGFNKTPEGFIWHHHQDGQTLLLVPKDLHNACRHTGGCAVIRNRGSFD